MGEVLNRATKRLLSVDDSRSVRTIIRRLFEPLPCEVIEAVNGLEGLKAASKYMPDLILLDVTMPEMNGKEMLQALKNDRGLDCIPVIMLTAEGGAENLRTYLRLGACGVVLKPFCRERLLEHIGGLIDIGNP